MKRTKKVIVGIPRQAPAYKPAKCPHCKFVAHSMEEEMGHMEDAHPDIVARRLSEAERESRFSSSWE